MTGALEGILEAEPQAAVALTPEPESVAESPTTEAVASTGVTSTAPPADARPQDEGPTVPRKALEDERRKRQEHERRLEELERHLQNMQRPQQQPPPPPPNVFEDPEGAFAYQQQIMAQQLYETRTALGSEIMRTRYQDYDEVIQDFVSVAQQNPALRQQVLMHPNPAAFAYEQGQRIRFLNEVGNDPNAYKQRLREQILAEIGQGQPVQSPAAQALAPKAPPPKSLAATPSAQPRDQRGRFAPGSASLDDILG